jgi:signal transduction histidine kinase
LFIADGLGHATTALGAPVLQVLHNGGASVGLQRFVATVFAYSWPWSIGLFLPLALVLFPDGRPPTPRWRPVVIALIVTAPLFVLEIGAGPEPLAPGLPPGYLTLSWHDQLSPLWTVSELRTLAALAVAIVAMVVRYRRGDDVLRRQLLWLLLATITAAGFVVPWSLVAGTPVLVLFAIPLIPVAVTIAIVRHRLLDIRLVVSRAIAWVLLSAGVVLAYGVLVAVLDRFVSAQLGRSAVATLVVALLVAPVLPRLQRLVDRALYGDRGDPARVVSRVGEQLAGSGLAGVVTAIRAALRVPYVAVTTPGGPLAEDGTAPDQVAVVPLEYGGAAVGELRVGVRPGEGDLGAADRSVLGLVAAPLAVAVHATLLSAQLQASRERIVAAQEEERRRLRRDLHDGLGPVLTGMAFQIDAATNLLRTDPDRALALLGRLRIQAGDAIDDVRRLVYELRPPSLDELGLVGALRRQAEQLDGIGLDVTVAAPEELPPLPAAVEVAAYRIAVEALTNAVRHSGADRIRTEVVVNGALEITVSDDGGPTGDPWRPGVGMTTMRERATEIGGTCVVGPALDGSGGQVRARLPLPGSGGHDE